MSVQVIMRDGEAEYAVLPWSEYQALLKAAGRNGQVSPDESAEPTGLERLAALREARGMTVQQLAQAVGVSPHYLDLIEKGERQPDMAIRRALARALGVAGWESPS